MKFRSKLVITGSLVLGICAMMPAFAMAGTTWEQRHPRRAYVLIRLTNLEQRISGKVTLGLMSAKRALQLRMEDRRILAEEERFAARHDGTITIAEFEALNRQLSAISDRIGE
jgi:DNA-directed RNA polymerase subunit K/omega